MWCQLALSFLLRQKFLACFATWKNFENLICHWILFSRLFDSTTIAHQPPTGFFFFHYVSLIPLRLFVLGFICAVLVWLPFSLISTQNIYAKAHTFSNLKSQHFNVMHTQRFKHCVYYWSTDAVWLICWRLKEMYGENVSLRFTFRMNWCLIGYIDDGSFTCLRSVKTAWKMNDFWLYR